VGADHADEVAVHLTADLPDGRRVRTEFALPVGQSSAAKALEVFADLTSCDEAAAAAVLVTAIVACAEGSGVKLVGDVESAAARQVRSWMGPSNSDTDKDLFDVENVARAGGFGAEFQEAIRLASRRGSASTRSSTP